MPQLRLVADVINHYEELIQSELKQIRLGCSSVCVSVASNFGRANYASRWWCHRARRFGQRELSL